MCHKTHTMTTKYGNHDMEDIPGTQDSAPLDLVPLDHTIPLGDYESSDENSKENNTCHPLDEFLEHFQQLQDQFACLKSATKPPTPTAELTQPTDKLQHLTMMLQIHPSPSLLRNQCTKLCRHTWTPCVQHTERGKPHHDHGPGYPKIQCT